MTMFIVLSCHCQASMLQYILAIQPVIATSNKILTLQRRKAPPYANFLMLKIMACDKKTSLLYDDFGQVTNKLHLI